MTSSKTLIRFLVICIAWLLHSCCLVKIPVHVQTTPIKDTVNVYHFIVTRGKGSKADTSKTNSYMRESKKAYSWLSKEAKRRRQDLIFKEHWITNKDSTLNYHFVYKLPSNSLKVLTRKHNFKMVTRKKTKTQEKKIERVNWNNNLLDSISKQVKDTAIAKLLLNRNGFEQTNNTLIAFHLMKIRKSRIPGFYHDGQIFIGNSRSSIIAHESLHYLGAPDLYIHHYWFGKRRRTVKRDMDQEVMNFAHGKTFDCSTYYISNYTAYTVGWDNNIDKTYKPILKQNLMAKVIFYISLFF